MHAADLSLMYYVLHYNTELPRPERRGVRARNYYYESPNSHIKRRNGRVPVIMFFFFFIYISSYRRYRFVLFLIFPLNDDNDNRRVSKHGCR